MQDSKSIAIIGAGPAGCMCAYFAQKTDKVTIFEAKSPLYTLLYTGGGRCNLAFGEYNFKELAKFYPRGEKFLYSVFSKFSTFETIEFFKKIRVETYTQEDLRIFPISNSAKEVRTKLLNAIKNCEIKKEHVFNIKKENNKFIINNNYKFDKIVLATGGHAGYDIAKSFGHSIISPKPSLVGLITLENFKPLQGVSLKNIQAKTSKITIKDDIIFTKEGISGPLVYKISSIHARDQYNKENPLNINLNFLQEDIDLQKLLDTNAKKNIKNLLSEFIPKSLAEYILNLNNISVDKKCHEINKDMRNLINESLTNFKINVLSPAKEGEIVTSGGIDLKEISSKDMQSKLVAGLYFCGEIINVDGFCGGFNLQNCWSTGFVAGNNI